MKIWSQSDTIALALDECTHCQGLGMRLGSRGRRNPCNCVFRSIFRICYNRFIECATGEKSISRAALEVGVGRQRRYIWGRKTEEFAADFYLVSKRTLNELEWNVFRFHFLLGAGWRLCCNRLGLDRGNFYHLVYRIEQKLGRTFRDLEPYALFPLDEYFGGEVRRAAPIKAPPPNPETTGLTIKVVPIRSSKREPASGFPEEKAA
jgi:hypothetical protein